MLPYPVVPSRVGKGPSMDGQRLSRACPLGVSRAKGCCRLLGPTLTSTVPASQELADARPQLLPRYSCSTAVTKETSAPIHSRSHTRTHFAPLTPPHTAHDTRHTTVRPTALPRLHSAPSPRRIRCLLTIVHLDARPPRLLRISTPLSASTQTHTHLRPPAAAYAASQFSNRPQAS
jgi:hypothetical protein